MGFHGNKYYGYEKDLYNKVKNSFISFGVDLTNIQLIKSYYEDTLKINDKVALAHIDCDWYDSVMISLERIAPYLTVGGVLIINDYYCYSGCKKAVYDYFYDKKVDFNFVHRERLVIEKIK